MHSPLYCGSIYVILSTPRSYRSFWYPFSSRFRDVTFQGPSSPWTTWFDLHIRKPRRCADYRKVQSHLQVFTFVNFTTILQTLHCLYSILMLSGFKGSRDISSLFFYIPVERVGDQGPYFTTEKSDLAEVTWGITGGGSSSPFSSAQAARHTSKEQSSSWNLSPEGGEKCHGLWRL